MKLIKLTRFVGQVLSLVFKGKIALALYQISQVTPHWLFRFSKAQMMYTETLHIPEIKNPEIIVKIGTIADLDDIIRISELDEDKIRYMLDEGVVCYLASDGTNPMESLVWALSGKCFIRGILLQCDFGDDSTYGFWAVTLPEARGKGLHYATLVERARVELKQGLVKSYALIEATNELSYGMRIRTGYTPSTLIYYLKLFFMKFSYVKDIEENRSKIRIYVKEPVTDGVVI